MTRKRAGSVAATATLVLGLLLGGCGGDPAPRSGPTTSDSPSTSTAGEPSSSSEPSDSSFPSGAPLPDGPWIPSPSLELKVPQGFKGDSGLGVTTLSKGEVTITIYDPNGLGPEQESLDAAIRAERKADFTGKRQQVTSGTATVDGKETQTFVITGKHAWRQRIAYGVGATDPAGDLHVVVVGFEADGDPTEHQDVIDSVLSSIRWDLG